MMQMRKSIILAMTAIMAISSGCGAVGNASMKLDKDAAMKLAENNFTAESYQEMVNALSEKERRSHYIDVEEFYQQAYFEYNKEFNDAYNYTLVDANGNKINSASNVDINALPKFINEAFPTWETMEEYVKANFADKESLLSWIESQRWYMDRPETEAGHQHADIMYIDYVIDGKEGHLEDNDIDTLTYDGLLKWLQIAYQADAEQYNTHKENKVYLLNATVHKLGLATEDTALSEEELERLYINYLDTVDFTNTITSGEITEVDGRHVVTEATVDTLVSTHKLDSRDSSLTLLAYNKPFNVDCSLLSQQANDCVNLKALQSDIKVEFAGNDIAVVGDTSNVNPDDNASTLNASATTTKVELPAYKITYNIDGDERTMIATTDLETRKLRLSKYDIYRFLDMKMY